MVGVLVALLLCLSLLMIGGLVMYMLLFRKSLVILPLRFNIRPIREITIETRRQTNRVDSVIC